jgi:hypothetical protein
MSIIISDSHREIAESEFIGRHPDTFSSQLAARLTLALAEQHNQQEISAYRADLNIQSLGSLRAGEAWIKVNIGGQLQIPQRVDVVQAARAATLDALEQAGYFRDGDFAAERTVIDVSGTTGQAPELNATTQQNRFADSCVVYGHYIAPPHGIQGTFGSLIIAKEIDEAVRELHTATSALRPDGKVHVVTRHTAEGPIAEEVYLSTAHAHGRRDEAIGLVKERLAALPSLASASISVNAGGDFDTYFLKADSGVSKAKDDVIITGGIHQLGTDRVWGKCLYKASSTLIPYSFALARAVCEATGAAYASVRAASQYGQEGTLLQLQEIDPAYEHLRKLINRSLQRAPRDRDSIREIVGLPVNIESYRLFNDVRGFHGDEKPWKRRNALLEKELVDAL